MHRMRADWGQSLEHKKLFLDLLKPGLNLEPSFGTIISLPADGILLIIKSISSQIVVWKV